MKSTPSVCVEKYAVPRVWLWFVSVSRAKRVPLLLFVCVRSVRYAGFLIACVWARVVVRVLSRMSDVAFGDVLVV